MPNDSHKNVPVLIKKLMGASVIRACAAALSVMSVVFISNKIGVVGVAAFHTATTFLGFWLMASKLGLDLVGLKVASRAKTRLDAIEIIAASAFKAFSPILICIPFAYVYLISVFQGISEVSTASIFISIFALVTYTVLNVILEYFRVVSRHYTYNSIKFLGPSALTLLWVVCEINFGQASGEISQTMFAPIYARGFLGLLGIIVLGMIVKRQILMISWKRVIKIASKQTWRQFAPVGAATALVIFINVVSVTILVSAGYAEDIAAHGVISRIMILLTMMTSVLSSIVAPNAAKDWVGKKSIAPIIIQSVKIMFPIGLAFITSLFILGSKLLGVFGAEYEGYYWELIVFGLAAIANSLPMGQLMVQSDLEWNFLGIMVFTTFVHGAGVYILYSNFGLIGVAFATLATSLLWNGWCIKSLKSGGRL